MQDKFGILDSGNQWNSTILYNLPSEITEVNGTTFYTQRALWTFNHKLVVASVVSGRNIVFSIPMYALYTDQSIDEMRFNAITV